MTLRAEWDIAVTVPEPLSLGLSGIGLAVVAVLGNVIGSAVLVVHRGHPGSDFETPDAAV